MSCPVRGTSVVQFLEGYCLEDQFVRGSINAESFTANATNNTLSVAYAYVLGDVVRVSNTGGALPGGLAAATDYWVVPVSTGVIKLATSYQNALFNTTVDLTSAGTGTHQIDLFDYLWIKNQIDDFIVPKVERWIRNSVSGIQTAVEYYSGNGKDILILNRRPVNTVTKIEYVSRYDVNWIINPSSIEVIQSEGVLKAKAIADALSYLNPLFPKGTNNIKITYTYGWATPPDDICNAIKMLAAEQALGFVGARTGGGSVSVQGYSRSYGNRGKFQDIRNDLARQAHAMLKKYMTSVVGA